MILVRQAVHGHRRTAHGKEEVVGEVHLQIEPGSTRRNASGVRQRGKGKTYKERLSASVTRFLLSGEEDFGS